MSEPPDPRYDFGPYGPPPEGPPDPDLVSALERSIAPWRQRDAETRGRKAQIERKLDDANRVIADLRFVAQQQPSWKSRAERAEAALAAATERAEAAKKDLKEREKNARCEQDELTFADHHDILDEGDAEESRLEARIAELEAEVALRDRALALAVRGMYSARLVGECIEHYLAAAKAEKP